MEILKRENYPGPHFDEKVGYSRAVRIGSMVFVGATSSVNSQGDVEGGGDAFWQARIIFQKIEATLKAVGASMRNVVQVRIYVTDIANGRDCLRAYFEWFKDIKPVITMVEVKALARVDRLVEVEAVAFMGSYRTSRLT
jgi:enamine deaminase RidA (YjgF/YER057c/UK114 family)